MRILLTTLMIWFSTLAYGQQSGIQSTIDAQITAFENDDFEAAFSHASPGIQILFGNATRFEGMVRSGFPMVVSPKALRYLVLRETANGYQQHVLIRDAEGREHLLEYSMIQLDQRWRIDGVRFLPLAPAV